MDYIQRKKPQTYYLYPTEKASFNFRPIPGYILLIYAKSKVSKKTLKGCSV